MRLLVIVLACCGEGAADPDHDGPVAVVDRAVRVAGESPPHSPSFADPIDGAFGQATVFPETTMSKPCRARAFEPAVGGAI